MHAVDAQSVADQFGVLTFAGDGPVIVMHTREELERFFRGVDLEASWLMAAAVNVDA